MGWLHARQVHRPGSGDRRQTPAIPTAKSSTSGNALVAPKKCRTGIFSRPKYRGKPERNACQQAQRRTEHQRRHPMEPPQAIHSRTAQLPSPRATPQSQALCHQRGRVIGRAPRMSRRDRPTSSVRPTRASASTSTPHASRSSAPLPSRTIALNHSWPEPLSESAIHPAPSATRTAPAMPSARPPPIQRPRPVTPRVAAATMPTISAASMLHETPVAGLRARWNPSDKLMIMVLV